MLIDGAWRGEKLLNLKLIADGALAICDEKLVFHVMFHDICVILIDDAVCHLHVVIIDMYMISTPVLQNDNHSLQL